MPTKTDSTGKRATRATPAAESSSPQQPRTPFPPQLKRPLLTSKSVDKASSVFKKFSLSKFPKTSTPSNYVAEGGNLAAVQKKIIAQNLHKLRNVDTSNRAMTFALPEAMIKKLLPSFNEKAATIQLSDVIKLIANNMKGTEFYASGNPTLNRLARQSQVQQIITAMKQGIKK